MLQFCAFPAEAGAEPNGYLGFVTFGFSSMVLVNFNYCSGKYYDFSTKLK